jgi:predicted nucleic acid-binding protein
MMAFELLERMAIEVVEVEHGEALVLVEGTGLTAYDASYLVLARRLGLELVTLDTQLGIAAGGLGWRQAGGVVAEGRVG